MTNDQEQKICAICGDDIVGFGHNPAPVLPQGSGRACDWCNDHVVIQVRLHRVALMRRPVK